MNLKWLDTGAQLISGVVELGSQLVVCFFFSRTTWLAGS